MASLLDEEPPVAPLDRLAREAVHGARNAMRGKRPEIVDAAVRSALRETVFRYELVMRINVTATTIDREGLIDAALSAQVALLTAQESRAEDVEWLATTARSARAPGRRATRRGGGSDFVEERYLDGHGALFPDVAAAWDEQVGAPRSSLYGGPAGRDRRHSARATDPEAISGGRPTRGRSVEPAKADALETLGEGGQALGIAVRWLRAKFVPAPTPVPDAPSR